MKYLLDTNVISETRKRNYNPNVKSFFDTLDWENMYLSVITIGELCYGVEKLPHNKKKHELMIWLYTEIPQWFEDRIISYDTEVLIEWGKLRAKTKRTLPVADSLIAASAIVHNMILVTGNVKDFEDIEGIKTLNPLEFGG